MPAADDNIIQACPLDRFVYETSREPFQSERKLFSVLMIIIIGFKSFLCNDNIFIFVVLMEERERVI